MELTDIDFKIGILTIVKEKRQHNLGNALETIVLK